MKAIHGYKMHQNKEAEKNLNELKKKINIQKTESGKDIDCGIFETRIRSLNTINQLDNLSIRFKFSFACL